MASHFPHISPILSHALLQIQTLAIAIRFQPHNAPLKPDSTLLMPAKRHLGAHLHVRINPHAPGLQPPRYPPRLLQIMAPHRGPQPHPRIVRARNNLLLVLPLQDGQDGPERLLRHEPRPVGRVVDDGRRDEVAGVRGRGQRATDGDGLLLGRDVEEEGAYSLVLHAVLHGAEEDVWGEARAELQRARVSYHGVAERVVDGGVDVDALERDADLDGNS